MFMGMVKKPSRWGWVMAGGLLLVGAAQAGQVYGTLRDAAGKPVAGQAIKIVSPSKTAYEGKTGSDGSFQIFVKETGRCELQLQTSGKAPATVTVFSYAEPARYELEFTGGALKVK